jgi:Flp pilus assembly pilin Flp
MAVNINVTEDENSIDINDVNVFTVHVKDLSTSGQIQISEDSSDITEDVIDTITEIRTIDLPADQPVNISVNEVSSDTVTIITTDTNVIEVSDNISIVTAASEAASRQLRGFTGDSLWNQFGNNATYTQGNVGIGTNSPNVKLEVAGNVQATSFTGTFIGAVSSSNQIAADISGAFAPLAATVATNTINISNNATNITANQSSITANLQTINTSISRLSAIEIITGSLSQSIDNNTSAIAGNLTLISNQAAVSRSVQIRLTNVEVGTTSKTLISGSAQIASEISGAFNVTSHSLQNRVNELEIAVVVLPDHLISGSAQIATEISGAFTKVSSSMQSRLSNVEAGSTSKPLISGSAQIATEISGAFDIISSSLQTRLLAVEAGSTSKTLISGSAQIASEISGAFDIISSSLQTRALALESKVGQDVNTTSNVEFNIISASNVRIDEDLQIQGDMGIGGTIFGLSGFGVTIDDIAVVSGSTHFGSGSLPSEVSHTRTGSMYITGSLDVTGPIGASSFTGTFIGSISSSAQIATQVSGAFTEISTSIQSRLTDVELELDNTLISGSVQIAADISGAFAEVSTSIMSRVTAIETNIYTLDNTLISGSAQISAEISGAFTEVSTSIQGRMTIVETGLNNTLISGSSQLATEISGAFNQVSHSLQSRLADVESGSTSKTLISSSAQIASEISGAFNNIAFDSTDTHGVVVYDNTAKRFYYTGSYTAAGSDIGTGTTTQYALSQASTAVNLSKLIINDFSDSVSVTETEGGILQLTFGNPTDPHITSFAASGFEPDRFNKEIDNYQLNVNINLFGQNFVKGELSASTDNTAYVGIDTFTAGEKIDIDSNLSSYQSGSHVFRAKVDTFNAFGAPIQIQSDEILTLVKSLPTDPVITFPAYSITSNAYNEQDMEIELGAIGSISVNVQEGDPSGWTAASNHLNKSSRAFTLSVPTTGNVGTGDIEEYWNSGTDNDPQRYHTGSDNREFTRVRSLRYKVDTNRSTPTEEELLQLTNWSGTIEAGINTKDAIEALTIEFNPSSEYIFIIYDAALGPLSSIINVNSTFDEISNFGSPEPIPADAITNGGYLYYRTKLPKENQFQYKLTFAT